MNSISHLSDCVSPVSAARVYNPINPDYYRKDASPAPSPAPAATSDDAVRITLSVEAQAAMRN